MLWLEMSKDEVHGGGSWAFTKCLWSPSRKRRGTKWTFWETLLQVEAGDSVLHLRGEGRKAAFVGFSIADANGIETLSRPPEAGQWDYSQTFYYVPLKEFTPFTKPLLLSDFFLKHDIDLRRYFESNKLRADKKRLFYVIQSGRLQCLNGAYLSEVDNDLARIILSESSNVRPNSGGQINSEVSTGEQARYLLARVGQKEFSDKVRANYGHRCCFPQCSISEDKFLVGAHIARWSDAQDLRGAISNGLCLCLMHDKAFEMGLYTISLDLRIWVDQEKLDGSAWGAANLIPFHGQRIRTGEISPLEEALFQHWERTKCFPEF